MAPNKVMTYDRDDPETSISPMNIAVIGDTRPPARIANPMKYSVLILSGTVFLTATISSTLSAVASFHELSQSPGIQLLSRSIKPLLSFGESDRAMASSSRIQLVEESNASLEAKQFIQTVQQAVRDRDAQFMRSLVTSETRFSFGEHRSINYLNPDNPKSPFWTQLEQAINSNCLQEANVVSCKGSNYQATFGKQNSKWTMQAFLTGD